MLADVDELSTERGVFHLAVTSRRLPFSWKSLLTVISLSVLAFAFGMTQRDEDHLRDETVRLAELGLTVATSILGFLIAGFTIFATLCKPALVRTMFVIPHKESGFSYLKFVYLCFVMCFVWYWIAISVFTCVRIVHPQGCLLDNIAHYFNSNEMRVQCLDATVYSITVGMFVKLLIELKSFIWNIYAACMILMRWEVEHCDNAPN